MTSPAVGDLVDLERKAGGTTRLKCPVCTKYVARRPGVITCHCGTRYEPHGSQFKVVA